MSSRPAAPGGQRPQAKCGRAVPADIVRAGCARGHSAAGRRGCVHEEGKECSPLRPTMGIGSTGSFLRKAYNYLVLNLFRALPSWAPALSRRPAAASSARRAPAAFRVSKPYDFRSLMVEFPRASLKFAPAGANKLDHFWRKSHFRQKFLSRSECASEASARTECNPLPRSEAQRSGR